jgi:hypothetical protein
MNVKVMLFHVNFCVTPKVAFITPRAEFGLPRCQSVPNSDCWAVGARVLRLRTMVMGIRFSNGNAYRVAMGNFLSRLWNLIDNQSRLKW